ncbi:hypothetical protein [Mycolicibacterium sp. 050158]|uniref:hypothetical protein n=1 Tax=Mycolicibacterium sp. 050158 TaxID=3090602 RepID=UPI00299D4BE5|nr:hypothetical protein [Mycolicibacterium sp. 050158]MDX1888425.1 hypothetical protein [Mycolicibacterium sp. 050158]
MNWSHLRAGLSAAGLATFVAAGVVVATMPAASAEPPASDERGFVDSTARCAPPSKAVAFGYTASSRVAICKDDSSGQFQYRGVRVSDGARLILVATSSDRGYVAENDGITYTVTSSALIVSSGGEQIRKEPMIDFHGSAPGSSSSGTSGASGTSGSSTTSTAPTQPSAVPVTPTPTTPLPPPLPAEVGHG